MPDWRSCPSRYDVRSTSRRGCGERWSSRSVRPSPCDAASDTGGGVRVFWASDDEAVVLTVEDEGPGLSDTANLFVPFFTTKPNGTVIGLALSRQIAEAHGGMLTLENRTDRSGVRAVLRLPLKASREA